jgi:hypothetical protein
MAALLISMLCLAAVAISGGSLYRKGRISRGTYVALVAVMAIIVAASAILLLVATRG